MNDLDAYARQEQDRHDELLRRIKAKLPELEELHHRMGDKWGEIDGIYRFYYGSLKVFPHLQSFTERASKLFQEIAGEDYQLCPFYQTIVAEGTGKKFKPSFIKAWLKHARPVLEAFFHSRFFVGMMAKYGHELDSALFSLPSGWAAILCLYKMR